LEEISNSRTKNSINDNQIHNINNIFNVCFEEKNLKKQNNLKKKVIFDDDENEIENEMKLKQKINNFKNIKNTIYFNKNDKVKYLTENNDVNNSPTNKDYIKKQKRNKNKSLFKNYSSEEEEEKDSSIEKNYKNKLRSSSKDISLKKQNIEEFEKEECNLTNLKNTKSKKLSYKSNLQEESKSSSITEECSSPSKLELIENLENQENQIFPRKSRSEKKSKKTSKNSSSLSNQTISITNKNQTKSKSKLTSNTNIPVLESLEKNDFFQDITQKLSNSLIYCREKEKEKILEFINNKNSKTLFICGQPGTGKTSLLLEIFKHDLKNFDFSIKIYINCMSVHSSEDFYYQIIKFLIENIQLLDNFKDRKTLDSYKQILHSKKNLNKNFLEILELYENRFTFLILLDEVDNFYQKQKEIIFYEILKTPYLADTNFKLMLISNNPEFDKEVMPKLETRKIKNSRLVFQPYSHNEIYEILKKKLTEINILEIFQDESLKYIAKKLANKMGDLRPAIEIVKNLILENKEKIKENRNLLYIGEANQKPEPLIKLKDLLIKFHQKNKSFIELINNLTTEQKIVLLSIYIIYDLSKNCEMDEKLILERYKKIKRENFNSESNIMDYREIIKTFCDMGIIECKNKQKGNLKIKYDLDDLEDILIDDKIFSMFK